MEVLGGGGGREMSCTIPRCTTEHRPFINQDGLLEGIKVVVTSCDRDHGGDIYQPKVAEIIFPNTLAWSVPFPSLIG